METADLWDFVTLPLRKKSSSAIEDISREITYSHVQVSYVIKEDYTLLVMLSRSLMNVLNSTDLRTSASYLLPL